MRATTASMFFILLGGCTPSGDPTTAELLADPASYEGRTIFVEGPITFAGACTAALCESPPCNNCSGRYVLGEPWSADGIPLVAGDAWPYSERTAGDVLSDCYGDVFCEGGQPIGCNGNDVELHCAPAVPARIVGVHGRVTRTTDAPYQFQLVVERFELAESPAEDTFEQPGWDPIRMME